MARIRTIKPDFFTSEDVSALPLRARLTWIGLWTHCDDHGRTKDVVRLIKAAIWPLDDVSLSDVEQDLITLAGHGRIVRYSVDGRAYLAIVNWHVHQVINRVGRSTIPRPPIPVGPTDMDARGYCPECSGVCRPQPNGDDSVSAHNELTDDSVSAHGGLTREGKGKEGNGKEGKPPASLRSAAPPATRGTRIPDDFTPTPGMIEWARAKTPDVPASEHDRFVDYWRSAPGAKAVKLDWEATWRNWMRRTQDDITAGKRPSASRNGKPSTSDQRVAQAQLLRDKYAAIDQAEATGIATVTHLAIGGNTP